MSKRSNNIFTFFDEIESDHSSLKHESEKFMLSRGWQHTSSTPGCVWMWQKTLPDGRIILTNFSTAVDIEKEITSDECPYSEIGG